jgi:hypothetical protein
MFTGYQPGNMGKNGELVFRSFEFEQLRKTQQGIIWFQEEENDNHNSGSKINYPLTAPGTRDDD